MHQRLKAGEGHRETSNTTNNKDDAVAGFMSGGKTLTQGVEHSDRGIKDHQINDDRHDHAEHWVNGIHQGQHRNIRVPEHLGVHEQCKPGNAHEYRIESAADDAAPASLTRANVVAANNKGHGHGQNQSQTVVVERGYQPVRDW